MIPGMNEGSTTLRIKKISGLSIKLLLALVALCLFSAPGLHAEEASHKSWFDRSHSIFFPPALKKKLDVPQSFPLFWWNFLVLESENWEAAQKTCTHLKSLTPSLLRVECEQSLREIAPLLADWRTDYSLRYPLPTDKELIVRFDEALAKASLPTGDPEVLNLLRSDPLESWRELQGLAKSRIHMNLVRKNGFFLDGQTHRIVIPVQMSFSPSQTQKTAEFIKNLPQPCADGVTCERWHFLGPHASTLTNESQVALDMDVVSKVGSLLLVVLGLGLILSGRWRLVFLIPPVAAAIGVSVGATILIFGSIHGLTLAFGTGIIGLALDYGLHAVFNKRSPRVWRSNLAGLFTTLIGLGVLMSSSIPLLRQMMAFSLIGLIAAYFFFYLLLNRYSDFLNAHPFASIPTRHPLKTGIAVALIACSFIGALTVHPNLDMRQFDFQGTKSKEITQWFYQTQLSRPPLFRVHENAKALAESHEEKNWAARAKVQVETLANYLPLPEVQEKNLNSWKTQKCQAFQRGLSETQRRFFAPFLDRQLCASTLPPANTSEFAAGAIPSVQDGASLLSNNRTYLNHLTDRHEWISLFLPSTEAEEALVTTQYPDARSLKSIVSIFPETFARELAWMVPLSLFLVTALLLEYYRKMRPALLALIPFFCGMGLVVVAKWAMGFEISFISVMAAIMVFGCSIDYGIFVNDIRPDADRESIEGIWTGLACSAFTTVAGFLPMIFCKHPILNQLGLTLFFGTLGTYIGTIWGIPGIRGK